MFSVKQLSIATVGTMAVGLGSVAPVNAASFYEIVGLDFGPVDINNSAQVVGQNYLWEDGNVTNLNTLPGAEISEEGFSVYATAINNNGTIVGDAYWNNPTSGLGFISDGSTISPLFNCEEWCPGGYVQVKDINDSGTIGVTAATGTSLYSLTIDSNGTQTNFLNRTIIAAINNQGQIVGTDYNDDNPGVNGFFSTSGGGITNLNPAAQLDPSSTAPSDRSNAYDLDDNGNIVGSGLVSLPLGDFASEATLWTDPTQPGVSLGTLGGENSEAFGINNSMQVVGSSFLEDDSTQHAFLWEDGNLIDLNSLIDPASGWVLTSAVEINDSGDIIGIGTYNGVGRGFVAKAVPEPSSVLGVLSLGLFGLSNWRKRKK